MSGLPAGTLAQALIAWQAQHGRHTLPWQNTRDPYRVWLSEIMLQQTQVSTVLGYYDRFLARFPDVAALAGAEQGEVLALWAGLGYYSRARNLHRCAQAVMAQHSGRFPNTAALLATLPGIGPSTAAAIAVFCFGERAAILDGNVKRVLSRALGFGEDLAVARHEKALWARAHAELPTGPGIEAYTQGLMDLGATRCLPRSPACGDCPWAAHCMAKAQGRAEAYPVRSRKLKRSQRALAWLVLRQGDRVWLVHRPDSGIWAGLWSLPEFESPQAVLDALCLAQDAPRPTVWPAFTHVLTHLDLRITPVEVCWPQAQALPSDWPGAWDQGWPGRWVSPAQALELGLPTPARRLLLAPPNVLSR